MKPVVASTKPIQVSLEAGKTYWWCTCGSSTNQPFCDGTHKGTEFRPLKHVAAESGDAWLCQCKHTGNAPLCDGAHKHLPS